MEIASLNYLSTPLKLENHIVATLLVMCLNILVLTWMFCAAGGHHEGLSAQECGGDVQVSPGGGGAVGYHGVFAGWSTDQHCVWNQVWALPRNYLSWIVVFTLVMISSLITKSTTRWQCGIDWWVISVDPSSIKADKDCHSASCLHSKPAAFLFGKVIIQSHNRICACLDAMWKVNFGWKFDFLMLSHCSIVHKWKIRKTYRPGGGSWILSWCICSELSMYFILLADGWLDLGWMTSRLNLLTQKGWNNFSQARWHKMSQLSLPLFVKLKDNQYIVRTIKNKSPLLLLY